MKQRLPLRVNNSPAARFDGRPQLRQQHPKKRTHPVPAGPGV
jgi:hypothetical protein